MEKSDGRRDFTCGRGGEKGMVVEKECDAFMSIDSKKRQFNNGGILEEQQ